MPIQPGDKIPQNLITWSREIEKKIAEKAIATHVDINVSGSGGGGGGGTTAHVFDDIAIHTGFATYINQTLKTTDSVEFVKADLDAVELVASPVTTQAPRVITWDSTYGTINVGLNSDVNMSIGQEMPIQAYNNTGSVIDDGIPVYVSGRHGHIAEITPARSDSDTTSYVIGITTCEFGATGDARNGYVTTFGMVNKIKTNYTGTGDWGTTWAVGDKLYVSKTVAGQLTNVEPTVPHHSDVVATVAIVGAIGTGAIFVNILKHRTLESLTDVDGTPLTATGQIAVWNNTAKYFDFDKNINMLAAGSNGEIQYNDGSDNFTADAGFTRISGITKIGDGTNYSELEADGTLKFVGTATVYDDLRVNLSNIKAPASDSPNWTLYKSCELPAYSATATNNLYFTAQLPHTYKQGTDLTFHIHAIYPNANTGNSRWRFTYTWANIDGTFSAETTDTLTFASPAVADANKIHAFTTISGTGKNISSVLLCSLSRLGADAADTYASVIYVPQADFHFEIDTVGSRTITAK